MVEWLHFLCRQDLHSHLTQIGTRKAKKGKRKVLSEEEAEESQAVEGNGEEQTAVSLTALAAFDGIQKGADELVDFGEENGEELVLKRLLELYPHYQQDVHLHLTEQIKARKAKKGKRKVVSMEEEEEVEAVSQSEEVAQIEEYANEEEDNDDDDDDNSEYGNMPNKRRGKRGRERGARKPRSQNPHSWEDALADFDEKVTQGGRAEPTEMVLKWRDGRARREGDELTKLEGKVPIPHRMKGLREEIDGILRSVADARDKDGGWSETFVSETKVVLLRLWKKLEADYVIMGNLRKRRDGVDIGEWHGTRYFEHLRNEAEDWAFVHLASIVYGIAWQLLFFNRKKLTDPPVNTLRSKTIMNKWLRTTQGSKPLARKSTTWYTFRSLWPHARAMDLGVIFARLGISMNSMYRKASQYRVIMENVANNYDQLLSKLGAVDPFRWNPKFFQGPIGMCLKEYEEVGPDDLEVQEDDHGGDTDCLEVESAVVKPAYRRRSERIRRRLQQQGLGTNLEPSMQESVEEVEEEIRIERRLSRDQGRKSKRQWDETERVWNSEAELLSADTDSEAVDEMDRREKRMRVGSESECAGDDWDMKDMNSAFESLIDDSAAAIELSD
ncbi:hypothetical protein HK102_003674 [Quaeritorhiza haematococci]|nr:hypothetical protein HK102_003674 [Quaeritorhiza haematococci]